MKANNTITLSSTTVDYIKNTTDVLHELGLSFGIIETDLVRGRDEYNKIFLLETENVPSLEFDGIALTRIPALKSRLDLLGDQIYVINADMQDVEGRSEVRSLVTGSRKFAFDYKTMLCQHVKSPRSIRDDFDAIVFDLTPEDVDLLLKAHKAFPQNKAQQWLHCSGNENEPINLRITDINRDSYDHTLESITPLAFSYKFDMETILRLLKFFRKETTTYKIGTKGFLQFKYKNYTCYVPPIV